MNLDSPGDVRNRAGSPRSPRLSDSFSLGPMLWYEPLPPRLPRRLLSNRRRTAASESRPGSPGIAPDPAAGGFAPCGPAPSVSATGSSAAEFLFALFPEAAVLLAAQHGLPVRIRFQHVRTAEYRSRLSAEIDHHSALPSRFIKSSPETDVMMSMRTGSTSIWKNISASVKSLGRIFLGRRAELS